MSHLISYKPVVTEKAIRLAGSGKFTFAVSKGAAKLALAHVIEEAYKVHVEAVNIVKKPAKRKQRGTQAAIIKAIVTLKTGERIPGFELPTAEEPKPDKKATVAHESHNHTEKSEK